MRKTHPQETSVIETQPVAWPEREPGVVCEWWHEGRVLGSWEMAAPALVGDERAVNGTKYRVTRREWVTPLLVKLFLTPVLI